MQSKYFKRFLQQLNDRGIAHIPPSATQFDGYVILIKDKSKFISHKHIIQADMSASAVRVSFRMDGELYGHPEPDEIKYETFVRVLSALSPLS